MISPDWCRMMAAYNAEMNRRLFGAADGLDDAARRDAVGAYLSLLQLPHHLAVGADEGCLLQLAALRGGADPAAVRGAHQQQRLVP